MTVRHLDPPQVWRVLGLVKVVDGDTFDLVLRRPLPDPPVLDLGVGSRLIEHREQELDARIRLSRVDTPERGQAGYREAGADVAYWFGAHAGEDVMVTAYVLDVFDRYVCDVYPAADPSATLTRYMLTEGNGSAGWPVWLGS